MKPTLFVGDSHLARLEKASEEFDFGKASFLTTPGPIASLLSLSGGKLAVSPNVNYLKNHPLAEERDLFGWLELVQQRLEKISNTTGLELSNYSAIVVVGYQLLNPEVWAEAALAYARGNISAQVWRKHCESRFELNHSFKKSLHFKFLDQINEIADHPKMFSVATPARSAAADFPRNLLKNDETGHNAFRLAESKYAELIFDRYGSELIPYPDSLRSDDGLCTSAGFQMSKQDVTHVNLEGSRLWFDAIFSRLEQQDWRDRKLSPSRD